MKIILAAFFALSAAAAAVPAQAGSDAAPRPVFNIPMPYDDAHLGVPTWNIRMSYETQEVMGPHIPAMVLIEQLYKPDVPTLGVVAVPLPPSRPRS